MSLRMSHQSEKEIEQGLLEGTEETGAAIPMESEPETDLESLPDSKPDAVNNNPKLMKAIRTGLKHLDVASSSSNDAFMTNKTMVSLMSDDDSEPEAEPVAETSSFTENAQQRRANRTKDMRDEQQTVRHNLLNGN